MKERDGYPPYFNHELAWRDLTGKDSYNPSLSKTSQLKSPALKYIHQFMAHALFGRGESTGVVNKNELFFLWAMKHNVKVNTRLWLLRHILHVSKQSLGKICIGGLISMIADAVGLVPTVGPHTRVEGNDRIDLDTLVHMKVFKYVGQEQYNMLDEHGNIIPIQRVDEDVEHQMEEDDEDDEDEYNMEPDEDDEEPARPHPETMPEEPARPPQGTMPSTSQPWSTLMHLMETMMERFHNLETMMHTNQAATENAFARLETQIQTHQAATDIAFARIEEKLDNLERNM